MCRLRVVLNHNSAQLIDWIRLELSDHLSIQRKSSRDAVSWLPYYMTNVSTNVSTCLFICMLVHVYQFTLICILIY